jgi:hypothetical protein
MSVDSRCRETRHFHVGETRHLYFEPTVRLRSLGRYGACCVRGLWKFSCLFTDRLARFCRLFSERPLRWREGSICCAVSNRYRNASRPFRKTLSAFCCVRGRVRSASRPQGGGAPGRGEQARIRSNVRRRAGTRTPHLYQLGCLVGRHGARSLGRTGKSRPKVDGQDSELAAEELPFEVHRARFMPVNSIL